MANPLIDNLTWNIDNLSESVELLKTNLNLLQVEWDTKLEQFEHKISIDPIGRAQWKALRLAQGLSSTDTDVQYQWLNPADKRIQGFQRYIVADLQPIDAIIQRGHSERLDISVAIASNTMIAAPGNDTAIIQRFQPTAVLPFAAYIYGIHIIFVEATGAVAFTDGGFMLHDVTGAVDLWDEEFKLPTDWGTQDEHFIIEWMTPAPIAAGTVLNLEIRGSSDASSVHPTMWPRQQNTAPDPSDPNIWYEPRDTLSFAEALYV